ncbi:nitrate reductase (NADH) [Blastomyces silverae]|uniref:Nitrate reductase [NADPH] n=1 Tax=Blastomyces silverae TaxID=2060906 RepID=A0A0H1BR22_9EURO|nr:nitrate reductase (NADH) [Blastomyces silverae]
MTPHAHHTRPRYHPGSTKKEIEEEPDWRTAGLHRIGLRNGENNFPGLTHRGDEWLKEELEHEEHAIKIEAELKKRLERGDLVTVRDVMTKQEDFHLSRPEVFSRGWRYVLHTTEDFIKNQQDWPANIQKRRKEEEDRKREEGEDEQLKKEHEWRRERGQNTTRRNAYASREPEDEQNENEPAVEKESAAGKGDDLKQKYSAQEIALLRALQHENKYMHSLKRNDGKGQSPMVHCEDQRQFCIDEADQFTPDNWVPRSDALIRLTGKHPFNSEPPLNMLYDAGLITPNKIHFVRNHGSVPHLRWQTHRLDVENGKLVLPMEELKDEFDAINIPVLIACDGNRRKEVNMAKRSKGFNWGPGACGCAYWKGPLLRDVLLAAGISPEPSQRRTWVNFEGADQPNEGKYATCIPLEYAMDPNNDVILAYEMNDKVLPPDHGYPVRVVIPGYVGGRCVKWLSRIWTSDKPNDSYYHVFDNRVVPDFITEMDSEFAKAMFSNPSTACNEQSLNSVIVKPAHGETLNLISENNKRRKEYRVEGYAYAGGGHEVQRVEVSLDDGKNWLYCIRRFPDAPIRHGKKFWTWVHWSVDVDIAHLAQASGITVRCFDVFKNCQSERLNWNLLGMMNNCWYTVRSNITEDPKSGDPLITFRHPTEPGSGEGGWMKPSTEEQIDEIRPEVAAPQKQFTREEIEKHDSESDCWIVINNKVYDATSVLGWHPGGPAAIMAHAGRVHAETTEEFDSIHDDYAQQKLSECVLGVVTDKTKAYIKKQAEESAKARATANSTSSGSGIQRHKWTQVRLRRKERLSEDTQLYTFALPPGTKSLGLKTCQHIQLGFHFADKLVIRPYTPVRPIFESEADGTFKLAVKTYFPSSKQPGGTMSNVLDCLREDEEVEVKGPAGLIEYEGQGQFVIDGKRRKFQNVTLILGGSGITPGYQLIAHILRSDMVPGGSKDPTCLRVIDANKTEDDILLADELGEFAKRHPKQFQIVHVLADPHQELTEGRIKGLVNKGIIREYGFGPEEGNVALLCGPPGLIKMAALPNLKDWGYKEDENLFGF